MRTVDAGLFYSVDGVVSDPHLWQYDSFDAELGAGMDQMIERTDTVLLGRVTYSQWSEFWPGADDDFGRFINPVQKVVASRTLSGDLGWQGSRLAEGDLLAAVSALKESDGGDISVCGSISIVRQLLFAGLLDTLQLMVHPVVAGSGTHLFHPGDPATRLVLQDSRTTSKGNALLSYGLGRD